MCQSEPFTKQSPLLQGVGGTHPRDDLYHSRLEGDVIFLGKKKKMDLFHQLKKKKKKHCEQSLLLFKSLTLLSSIYNQSSSGMFDS